MRSAAEITKSTSRPSRARRSKTASCSTAPAGTKMLQSESWRVLRITSEFVAGFDHLAGVYPAVSIFGSARTQLSERVLRRGGQDRRAARQAPASPIITGGGPGIMEAANKGARQAGALSIGCNIELPFEQKVNPFVDKADDLPLLLRPQDDVHQVLGGLHHLSRRLRHARRADGRADADPDEEDHRTFR